MTRWLAYLCVGCFVGAIIVFARPDPWGAANAKADLDIQKLSASAISPDRVSLRLSEDTTLLRFMILDTKGTRQYPPPGGMTPLAYELSEDTLRRLTAILEDIEAPVWTTFDPAAKEMLHCRATPSLCLVYDRAALEDALDLRADALLSVTGPPVAGFLLAALACVCGAVAIWLKRRQTVAPLSGFHVFPERHIALRGDLEIPLSPRDLKLLSLLQDRDGDVVTKDELYDAAWGRDYMPNSRALDQHIITLRRKLDPNKSLPVLIETVRGVGYRLVK